MKIILEDSGYTRCPIEVNEYSQFTINIDGKDLYFQVIDQFRNTSGGGGGWEIPKVYWIIEGQQIQQLKVKTLEEKAAEESVAKAKDALKAAENALKIVKEQKK